MKDFDTYLQDAKGQLAIVLEATMNMAFGPDTTVSLPMQRLMLCRYIEIPPAHWPGSDREIKSLLLGDTVEETSARVRALAECLPSIFTDVEVDGVMYDLADPEQVELASAVTDLDMVLMRWINNKFIGRSVRKRIVNDYLTKEV